MTIDLSSEEVRYLLDSLVMAREYYRLLATSSKAQTGNIQRYRLVESLGKKLEGTRVSFSDLEKVSR